MRSEENIRKEMANLQKAIIEEEDTVDWMPWEMAPNIQHRNSLSAALMALEWALGEERWRRP